VYDVGVDYSRGIYQINVRQQRRPFPMGAQDIGYWQGGLVFLSFVAVGTNLAVVIFQGIDFAQYSYSLCVICPLLT
jgi:hypothetical protein